jgi:6-pyruvoyl-tetrahydropterin synthase
LTTLLVAATFSATHRIRIGGELEPVHGHDFRVEAEVRCGDDRDAAPVAAALAAVLAGVAGTDLGAVARAQGGAPSAERIAAHLRRLLADRLAADPALAVAAVTVHEAPGCSATSRWRPSQRGSRSLRSR